MATFAAKRAANELRQRSERHRLLARRMPDKRAAEALFFAAVREAALADEMERLGDQDESGATAITSGS
jgi:hypothetical protein